MERQAKGYNERHQEQTLKRGDLVGLSTKHIRLKDEYRKLTPRFVGPFRVLERIGSQAYRLALPEKYSRLHNVFHVSRLEPWTRREGEADEQLPMPDLDEEEDDEWEVESVKDYKTKKGVKYFLVKWKSWPAEYNQWVAEDDMDAPKLIADYEKSQRKRSRVTDEPRASKRRGHTAKQKRS